MGVNQSKGSVDITSTPNKGKVAEDIVKPEINGKSDEKIIDEKTTVRNCFEKCSMNLQLMISHTRLKVTIFIEAILLLNRYLIDVWNSKMTKLAFNEFDDQKKFKHVLLSLFQRDSRVADYFSEISFLWLGAAAL